jgi:hypothetical protein
VILTRPFAATCRSFISCPGKILVDLACILILDVWLFSPEVLGQAQVPPKSYICCQTQEHMRIDGQLDEQAWKDAPWTDDFIDIEGKKKPAPRFRTRAKMLWDESCLYVGAELQEPAVWATILKPDSVIYRDNDFEIFIDPNSDNHEYFEFEINALNTLWDLFLPKPYRDGGHAIDAWNAEGIRTAVHVDGTLNDPSDVDHGWSVEFAIPWRALSQYAHMPTPPHPGDHWRVNFSRVEWHYEILGTRQEKTHGLPEDNWVWSPTGIIDMHQPEQWGYVQFSTNRMDAATFTQDKTYQARMFLYEVYCAQKEFRRNHGYWAPALEQLMIPSFETKLQKYHPALATSPDGYVATVQIPDTPEGGRLIHIRQDSLVWIE